jgi:hypothetical protein
VTGWKENRNRIISTDYKRHKSNLQNTRTQRVTSKVYMYSTNNRWQHCSSCYININQAVGQRQGRRKPHCSFIAFNLHPHYSEILILYSPVPEIPQLVNIFSDSNRNIQCITWIVLSSGIRRCVVHWKSTDISEENVTTICRVKE